MKTPAEPGNEHLAVLTTLPGGLPGRPPCGWADTCCFQPQFIHGRLLTSAADPGRRHLCRLGAASRRASALCRDWWTGPVATTVPFGAN